MHGLTVMDLWCGIVDCSKGSGTGEMIIAEAYNVFILKDIICLIKNCYTNRSVIKGQS